MKNEVGLRIKSLRLEKGMTLEEVAKKVGVGKSTVRKWETGMIENMKRDKVLSLAKALDTTPDYLMCWEESHTVPIMRIEEEEKELLSLYREAPDDKKGLIINMIQIAIELYK